MSTAQAWGVLLIAGLLEAVWALSLKASDGFTRLWPSLLTVVAAAASFYLLALALRILPAGTGYIVWVGVGSLLVAAFGIVVQNESADPLRLASLLLILGGVAGLARSSF